MNKPTKPFLIIIILLLSVISLNSSKVVYNTNKWELVWIENFDGAELDTIIWGYMKRGRDDSRKYHSSNPNCYELKNGKLILKGIVNPDLQSDTAKYLTGGITTEGKKAFPPGRIEIKAKIGSAEGAWPAFWMLPFKMEKGWPTDGEIDIMEHLNFDKFVYQTLHSSYTKSKQNTHPINYTKSPLNMDDYNVYRVDILKDRVDFYVNDNLMLSYPNMIEFYGDEQYPYFRDWYLMLDMQLGGKWAGPLNHLDLPVEMEIDWVKYYRHLTE